MMIMKVTRMSIVRGLQALYLGFSSNTNMSAPIWDFLTFESRQREHITSCFCFILCFFCLFHLSNDNNTAAKYLGLTTSSGKVVWTYDEKTLARTILNSMHIYAHYIDFSKHNNTNPCPLAFFRFVMSICVRTVRDIKTTWIDSWLFLIRGPTRENFAKCAVQLSTGKTLLWIFLINGHEYLEKKCVTYFINKCLHI